MSQAAPPEDPGQGHGYQPTAVPCAMLVLLPLQRLNEENTRELQEETTALPLLSISCLPACSTQPQLGKGSGCASKRGLAAAVAAPLHNPIHLSSVSLTTLSCILSNKGIFLSWISFVLPKETRGAPGPPSPKEPTTYPGVPALLPQ